MILSIRDEKDEVVAIVSTKEEADKIMKDHSKWVLKELFRIWP